MDRRQEIIEKITSKEVSDFKKEYGLPRKERRYAVENEETVERQELEVSLRRERERADIVPLSKLTKQASIFAGGNNCSQSHEEERYWDWVEKVPKDMVFVFEGQDKEIYALPADSLWHMGNKSAREDLLLGTRRIDRIKGGAK